MLRQCCARWYGSSAPASSSSSPSISIVREAPLNWGSSRTFLLFDAGRSRDVRATLRRQESVFDGVCFAGLSVSTSTALVGRVRLGDSVVSGSLTPRLLFFVLLQLDLSRSVTNS